MIIGLSGYARSGKDCLALTLIAHGFTRVAFADALREALYCLNPIVRDGVRVQDLVNYIDWEATKNNYPEVRNLLQRMGTEVGRELYGQNFWVERAFAKVQGRENVVFTDVRFPNEFDAVKSAGGQMWRINRPNITATNAHVSETALDGFPFDIVIDNDGTLEELESKCLELLNPPQ